jgi:hypothetical protein
MSYNTPTQRTCRSIPLATQSVVTLNHIATFTVNLRKASPALHVRRFKDLLRAYRAGVGHTLAEDNAVAFLKTAFIRADSSISNFLAAYTAVHGNLRSIDQLGTLCQRFYDQQGRSARQRARLPIQNIIDSFCAPITADPSTTPPTAEPPAWARPILAALAVTPAGPTNPNKPWWCFNCGARDCPGNADPTKCTLRVNGQLVDRVRAALRLALALPKRFRVGGSASRVRRK